MSDDIVYRLRCTHLVGAGAYEQVDAVMREAADEIERLRAELAAANADAERLAEVMATALLWMPSSAHDEASDCDVDTLMRDALAAHRERIRQ